MTVEVEAALRGLGVSAAASTVLKDEQFGNSSWFVESADRGRMVLRRYHDRATAADIAYEHAVLLHLASTGWAVPAPIGEPVELHGRIYCLNRFVPGKPATATSLEAQTRRGRDLARLHIDLRGLAERLGQRPGWQAQHRAVAVRLVISWDRCLSAFADVDRHLAEWAARAAEDSQAALADLDAQGLPEIVVHGDFAEWNVHYGTDGVLAGVIDFGLTHVDSRPYELAIARTYRAPTMADAYRAELYALSWPLDELEEACVQPIYSAFRVDMVAWLLDHGFRTSGYDLKAIERHLARTATPAPWLPRSYHRTQLPAT